MAEGNKPTRLDAGIDDSVFEKKNSSSTRKKKESKALPYLLGVLVLAAGYFIATSVSNSGPQMELTPEQEAVQNNVSGIMEDYISVNGSLPENPADLNLPEGSEVIVGDNNSWMVSTPEGQLILSENALPPFDDGPPSRDTQ